MCHNISNILHSSKCIILSKIYHPAQTITTQNMSYYSKLYFTDQKISHFSKMYSLLKMSHTASKSVCTQNVLTAQNISQYVSLY